MMLQKMAVSALAVEGITAYAFSTIRLCFAMESRKGVVRSAGV